MSSCTALAQVIGAPLAAAILTMDGLGGLRGWQWLFLLEGGATVLFGVALRLCLAHSPARAHRVLTHAEREWLCQQKAAEREAASAARPHPQSRWKATMGAGAGLGEGGGARAGARRSLDRVECGGQALPAWAASLPACLHVVPT